MAFCLLLAGCASSQTDSNENTVPAATEDLGTVVAGQLDDMRIISPLPDTAMENLSDAIFSVSPKEGDAYVDDSGIFYETGFNDVKTGMKLGRQRFVYPLISKVSTMQIWSKVKLLSVPETF